ncbi:MAG: hypothetical protein IT348_05045 [Candidatus Eisenbacteria bacterium]|nr:hypothetical protein [Candidatus Eisenbacteria bacterium]
MRKTTILGLLSILLLSTNEAVSAQTATLYTVEYSTVADAFTIGAAGSIQGLSSPSQLLFGALPTGSRTGEVAIAQAVLNPGDMVPLPKYLDGTEASESEIFWTVQLWQAKFPHYMNRHYMPTGDPNVTGDHVTIGFSGRTYGGGYSILAPYFFPSQETRDISVAVTVIAVRQSATTAERPTTFGSVKVQSR